MQFDVETLRQQIPYYLTAEDRQVLVRELDAIGAGGAVDYFLSVGRDSFKDKMLQGDGWRGFRLFQSDVNQNHRAGWRILRLFRPNPARQRSVRGLVLSNSCDIDPGNIRELPTRVIFAPLVKLSAYKGLLERNGVAARQIRDKIAAIKAQKTTNVFYLPAGGPLDEEHIVRFDEANSMLVAEHTRNSENAKLFTLSNTGFYMLALKLSVHFCRLQEKINRKP